MSSNKTKCVNEESEEDLELKEELKTLVEKLEDKKEKLYLPALEMLKFLIKTATTSMTSVPKPLKYLSEYYTTIKNCHKKMKDINAQKVCADVISVLALSALDTDEAKINRDCLNYCLIGTMGNIGDWGHEYVRQLENEIVAESIACSTKFDTLLPLIHKIIEFDSTHNAEIQACDMLMELDKLHLLDENIIKDIYARTCLYLANCATYVDETESLNILKFVYEQYIKFNEHIKALMIAMQLHNSEYINQIFNMCDDPSILKQMAFVAGRQQVNVNFNDDLLEKEELENITCNTHLNSLFYIFGRELDVMAPKTPEELFRNWEDTTARLNIVRDNVDSSKQNLASSFVNAFINAGFGNDKLITVDGGNKWIFRHKEHAMFSATASLGFIHLWDVDGGLTPIDKYLYADDARIKGGALLALGIVNCRVRNECDPALALLSDYISSSTASLQIGSIFGLGLAYAGTHREDVINLLLPIMLTENLPVEVLAITSIACGLIGVSSCHPEITLTILQVLIDNTGKTSTLFNSSYGKFIMLGLGLCYIGRKDAIEAPLAALEVFDEPVRSITQTILQMCGYAGTGDVLIIQEFLRACCDDTKDPEESKIEESPVKSSEAKKSQKKSRPKEKVNKASFSTMRAMAGLGVAVVALGDEIGKEMCPKICSHMSRYGDVNTRKIVPLAIALCSISDPQLPIVNILQKYSHELENEVACNAIFAMGLVGAGSNNARLSSMFRHLAAYHKRNSNQLFMVRVAQGLVNLGKGTLTLNPLHTDKQLFCTTALAGLLITIFAVIDNSTVIFGKSHYLLYALAAAIQPRWLITLDENMEKICVPVRIGQAVDVVGKAGIPKTIAGIQTQSTPVLLAMGERAELATDQYEPLSPYMEGIVILRKKEGTE